MSEFFRWLGVDLVVLLVLGLTLLALMRGARFALELVPMSKARRAALGRAAPVLGALFLLLYLLFAVRTLFRDQPAYLPLGLSLVLAGFAAAAWTAVRDLLAGVALKAGRVCQVGDRVRIEGIEGRVARMGYRVLVLETTRGDEVVLPYGRVAREAVVRTRTADGVASHEFTLQLPPQLSTAEARERIRRAALLCHWAAVAREPEVAQTGDAELAVTVFSLDPEHATEIERAVRATLAPAAPGGERDRGAALSA